MKISVRTLKKYFLMIILGVITVWSNRLPGINLPGVGTMFPLRIVSVVFGSLFLLQKTGNRLYKETKLKLFLMLFYGFASLLWCPDINAGISVALIYITSIFSVFTVFYMVKDDDDIVLLCRVLAINALIIGVMGIYESATGNYFVLTKERYSYSWVINSFGWKFPHAIFGNTNDFATFMVAMMPIICIAVKDLKNRFTIQYIGFIFCTFCVFLTDSRLCVILCCVFLLWLFPKKSMKSVGLVVVATLFIVFLGYRYWNLVSKSFASIINISIGEEDRIQIWGNCIANIFRTWTFGVGVGNSAIANRQYYLYETGGIYSPHNYFLEIFEEFGLFGFVCFFSWLLMIITQLKKNRHEDTGKYLFYFFVLYVFLTICSSSLRQAYYFWVIFAVCLVYAKRKNEAKMEGMDNG